MTKTILNHHGIPLKMENTENVVRFTTIFPGSSPRLVYQLVVWRF